MPLPRLSHCAPPRPPSQHADRSLTPRSRQALPGLPFEAREESDHLVIDAHKIGGCRAAGLLHCAHGRS